MDHRTIHKFNKTFQRRTLRLQITHFKLAINKMELGKLKIEVLWE